MAKNSKKDNEPILGDGVPTPEVKAAEEKDLSPDATVPVEPQPDTNDTESKEH